MNKKNKIIAISLATSLSLALASAPVVGEMVATAAPLFSKNDNLAIRQLGLPYEQVEFPTRDGLKLRGWFIPAGDPHAPAVVYAPATAHDQRQGISLVAPLHAAGFRVLLFSYRGTGGSQGNRLGFSYGYRESQDLDAAVCYLYEVRKIRRISVIGHSAGAVSTILSAARNPRIGAVVAASPYSSLEDIWMDNRPAIFPPPLYRLFLHVFELRKGFSRQSVRPLDVIERIAPRPVMLVFGQDDQRITSLQAERLIEAARQPKQVVWLEGASHSQVQSPGLVQLMGRIVAFFRESLREGQVYNKQPITLFLN